MEKIDLTGSRILIVDDDPMMSELLGKTLEGEYDVGMAASGEAGLSEISRCRPDLLLLDLVMPGIGGIEVCRRLKADPATCDIPVLFLTVLTDCKSKVNGFSEGCADYITKPFMVEEVKARVRTHLALKRASDALARHNRHLEEMLEKRTRELIQKERDAAFSLMLQGIVHNLKNPLSVIRFGAEMITMTAGDTDDLWREKQSEVRVFMEKLAEIADTAGTVMTAIEKVNAMINSMLAKGRQDNSRELEVVDLNGIIRQELDFLDADLKFKNEIHRTVALSCEALPVRVVPAEIGQILQNLLKNAMDAMWNLEDPALTLSSGKNESFAWFAIVDNGPGIPEKMQSMIFDPFFTTKPAAGSDMHGEPTGTGLGLHVCRESVRSYNGQIDVESQKEAGTRFVVFLPCHGQGE